MSLKTTARPVCDGTGFFYLQTYSIYFVIVTALSALGYWLTLCPTVEYIDSGELALACKNFGIAHPTGYPLYTALGRIASIILPGSLILKMNALSLIFTSLASGFLFLLMIEFAALISLKSEWLKFIVSAIALNASFAPIWWAQGTTNEVYSLNLLLISISLWALFKYLNGKNKFKWAILSAYVLGLSLTNHLSAIYIVPAYLYILFHQWRKNRIRGKDTALLIFAFLFPVSIYLILPLRARFTPFLNWGGVDDLYFLYKHISGWQYRIWMFNDPNFNFTALIDKISNLGYLLYKQSGWFGLITASIGILLLFSRKTYLAIFAVIIVLFNFLYASNYEIIDIESYYLPMIIMFSILTSVGTIYLLNSILKLNNNKVIKYTLIGMIVIIPLSNFVDNFFISDRSNKTYASQGVHDMISSMEPNALAIIENWDFYSPWMYFHFEDSLRPDIVLLDKELMRRSWYIDFIKRKHPTIYQNSREYFEEFLRKVAPFERSLPFNSAVIDKAYYEMLFAVVENESKNRPVYTNIFSDDKFTKPLPLIPAGVLLRVYSFDSFMEVPLFEFNKTFWGNKFVYKDKRIASVLSYYRTAFSKREKYCWYFDMAEEADYYKKMTADVSAVMSEIPND